MPGGFADPELLPKGPNGRSLCRWCNLEVPPKRSTFCSDWCVNEWKLRTQPGYLRDQVFERDRGICAGCGIDCEAEIRRLKRVRAEKRAEAWKAWGLRPRQRRTLWDADHIIPVVEGGGECDLDNIRTLCLRCHKRETALLRERRKNR
jgi:5-methylcytosine-specific restriction protein A